MVAGLSRHWNGAGPSLSCAQPEMAPALPQDPGTRRGHGDAEWLTIRSISSAGTGVITNEIQQGVSNEKRRPYLRDGDQIETQNADAPDWKNDQCSHHCQMGTARIDPSEEPGLADH